LIIDMVLGLGGSLAGGWIVLALAPPSAGMLAMLAVGFAAAGSVIVVQRVCWRSVS